ncbi:hypothetical protein KXQ82_00330 [Mucilaginibacter sp. HMF5004]|uniref:hypothetical protein n=1 Tax=Mucilaginibacter rivuli TaxID=2857527 RepID=UPI001C5DBEB1|nr:hypothetical protein [Mucilaginibacter rivuli]MBW4888132.1 hypothetical protein [Mucilaginibacter rivuli]
MKKVLSLIALAAISFGSVYAATPVKNLAVADTTVKVKKTHKGVIKKKTKMKKDTAATKM